MRKLSLQGAAYVMSFFVLSVFVAKADLVIAPTLEKCECRELEVSCSDSNVKKFCGSMSAGCAQSCRLVLSEKLCADHGLKAGTVALSDFQAALACNLDAVKAEVIAAKSSSAIAAAMSRIADCGTMVHETFHACIPEAVASERQIRPCDEWGGNFQERQIFRRTIESLCSNKKEKNEAEKNFCSLLCKEAYSKDLNINWNKRLCDEVESYEGDGEWLSADGCCAAYNDCLSEKLTKTAEWVPEYCKREVYDAPDFRKEVEGQLAKVCSILAFSEGGYSCQEMSKAQEPFRRCK